MDSANFSNRARLSMGAPVRIDAFSVLISSGELESPSLTLSQERLKPRCLALCKTILQMSLVFTVYQHLATRMPARFWILWAYVQPR